LAVYRAQLSFQLDSSLPRDAITMNPHFTGDNAQGLANMLKTNLTGSVHVGATVPFHIKIYDAQKDPPNYPLAEASQTGAQMTTTHPRELALCLSYYANDNIPVSRGRVYVPQAFIGGASGLRPTTQQQQAALDFASIFTINLPTNHHWVVYSRKLNQANNVTDTWVDDEWDVMRSRGLRGTSRLVGTIP